MEHAPTVPRLIRCVTLLAIRLRLRAHTRKRDAKLAGQGTQLVLGNEILISRRRGKRSANGPPRNHLQLALGAVTALAATAPAPVLGTGCALGPAGRLETCWIVI